MAKGIIDMLIDAFWTDERVGKLGEKLTERELKLVRLFGRKGKILKNIYLPKEEGGTSEIDVVYITPKGIFVIESKNYSGWIFGDEKSAYWTASLPNGQKNRFYSPIKQNQTHIKWLNLYLESHGFQDVPMYSLIVFSERCEIKKMSVTAKNTWVFKRDELYAYVRAIWDSVTDRLSESEVEQIYQILQMLTGVDDATKDAHVKNIRNRFYAEESNEVQPVQSNVTNSVEKMVEESPIDHTVQSQTTESSQEMLKGEQIQICPKCGANLILRTAKKGSNAGNQFWGCSNFPKCRFIKNV